MRALQATAKEVANTGSVVRPSKASDVDTTRNDVVLAQTFSRTYIKWVNRSVLESV